MMYISPQHLMKHSRMGQTEEIGRLIELSTHFLLSMTFHTVEDWLFYSQLVRTCS